MKTKSFLIAMLCAISAVTFGQTGKGRFVVSGKSSLDFTYTQTNLKGNIQSGFESSESLKNLNIASSAGYFFIDNLAANIEVAFTFQKDNADNRFSQFSIMPGAMYYFPVGGIVRPFVQAGIGYVRINSRALLESDVMNKLAFNGYTWGGAVGASFFVRDNISIDLSAQYASVNAKYKDDSPNGAAIVPASTGYKILYLEGSSYKMRIDGLSGAIGLSLFF